MAPLTLTGVLVWLFISVCADDLCSNLDDNLCQLIAKEEPNMCENSCMANLCKRFCGICPLLCYACHEIDDAGKCQQTVQCNTSNEYCFTAQTFDDHFQETYKLGCAPINTCLQYSSISHYKRVGVDAGCCNADQCNNKPPVLLHITNTTSSTLINANSNRSLCENLSDDICARLSVLMPNICTNTCIANNICPHMCGKCYNCLSCDEVASPDKCNTTVECTGGKECFVTEEVTHDFKLAVRLGCVDILTCQNFQSSATDIFGKRQSFSLKGRCCKGEKCNANVIPATTALPVLPGCSVMKQCPDNFHLFDQYCYHLGNSYLTKNGSKEYCRQHCSYLAEFNTTKNLQEFLQLSEILFNYNINRQQDFQAFLGIENINHSQLNAKWVWDMSGLLMEQSMDVSHQHANDLNCMIGIYKLQNGFLMNGLQNVGCNNRYKPLCQIKLSL